MEAAYARGRVGMGAWLADDAAEAALREKRGGAEREWLQRAVESAWEARPPPPAGSSSHHTAPLSSFGVNHVHIK